MTVQTGRSSLSPLTLVLPHPALPRRRSSHLSANSSPRTPSCGSPTYSAVYFTPTNRKSTDSWNSSNYDFGDDEAEWKQEQVLLLQRTLDALPAHLVTPFNGPIPPSNLLDKIARGVSQAKGPNEWTHSLRATRVKLIELARLRASDDLDHRRKIVTDENDEVACYTDADSLPSVGKRALTMRRPIYRQSSMDFLGNSVGNVKDSASIANLSNRLQRAERSPANPTYHPYNRATRSRTQAEALDRRSASPLPPMNVPSLISPSNPSSSTLNSLSSISAGGGMRPRYLRRSASTLSSMTTSDSLMSSNRGSYLSTELSIDEGEESQLMQSAMPMAADPRIQRVRRSESFCGLSSGSKDQGFLVQPSKTPPARQAFKRAPSFGALAQEAKARGEGLNYGVTRSDVHYTLDASSDEEEKSRSRSAKKPRTKPVKSSPPVIPHGVSSPTPRGQKSRGKAQQSSATKAATPDSPTPKRSKSSKTALKRSLDKDLPLLPKLQIDISAPEPMFITPVGSPKAASRPLDGPPAIVEPRVIRTLRRVGRMAPSRRISFGSLAAPQANGNETDFEGDDDSESLGSAFQLR